MQAVFFELEDWEKEYIRSHLPDIGHVFVDGKLDLDHLPDAALVKDAEVLSVFVGSSVTDKVLEHFPSLKLVCTRSTGFDHIDVAACRVKNVAVSTVPTYGTSTVAEYAFALILALVRKTYLAVDRIRETGSFSVTGLSGTELKGKTLGVVGTGNIGREVVRIAKGFLMNVVAFDAYPNAELSANLGFTYVPLDELLAASDIVTLHVPYMPATHHLMNGERLEKVKKGALLINTARGGIVDTNALIKALHNGTLGGAGLDVLEEEGAIKDERELVVFGHPESHDLKTVLQNHVLIDMPNVIVTPHNAFNTTEALREIMAVTVQNVQAYRAGAPANTVK